MSVFSNFLTNFNVRTSNLFLKTSTMESLDGNLSLVRKINTNDITKIITTYCVQNDGQLSKSDLFKLLERATRESSFVFDYLLYKQVDGVAMSSPLGPTLVNVFLCHHEKEWLDNCPIHYKPAIYKVC